MREEIPGRSDVDHAAQEQFDWPSTRTRRSSRRSSATRTSRAVAPDPSRTRRGPIKMRRIVEEMIEVGTAHAQTERRHCRMRPHIRRAGRSAPIADQRGIAMLARSTARLLRRQPRPRCRARPRTRSRSARSTATRPAAKPGAVPQGWLLAREEINAAGGVLGKNGDVFRDDNANPGDAVRVAEELRRARRWKCSAGRICRMSGSRSPTSPGSANCSSSPRRP